MVANLVDFSIIYIMIPDFQKIVSNNMLLDLRLRVFLVIRF